MAIRQCLQELHPSPTSKQDHLDTLRNPGQWKIPTKSPALSNKTRIISIGSIYPRKRQLDLAGAVINLSKRHEVECFFLGSLKNAGAYGPQARHFFETPHESLHWLGGVSEDEKLQRIVDSDIACFPSGDETFGISALETVLLGKPVILADLPVYREVGWIEGKNCLMLPVGDVAALEGQLENCSATRICNKKFRSQAGNWRKDTACMNSSER